MKIQLSHSFRDIISVENLFKAWREFIRGKRKKRDVQEFSSRLMDNILELHHDLKSLAYKHGGYQAFRVSDPKPRNIHKASVRDRLLHRAIYRVLYPFFDKTFIADSYSCRLERSTYKAVDRFSGFAYRASQNNTRACWILKGDIKKFFASIDHFVLSDILREYIPDENIMRLLNKVISSFSSGRVGVGLPLGNLTSQLFANIYLNEFDQFVKHKLKAEYYIRYADDFVILSADKKRLEEQRDKIKEFLCHNLKLDLHSEKIFIKTLASGVDFLGPVNFFDHRILRTKTKKRMLKNIDKKHEAWQGGLISEESFNQTLQSYLGLLKHCNGYKIERELRNLLLGCGSPYRSTGQAAAAMAKE